MLPIYNSANGMISEGEDGSLVLEEQIDPNYIPTQKGEYFLLQSSLI